MGTFFLHMLQMKKLRLDSASAGAVDREGWDDGGAKAGLGEFQRGCMVQAGIFSLLPVLPVGLKKEGSVSGWGRSCKLTQARGYCIG